MNEEGRRGDLGMTKGEKTENIPKEGIEVGAGGRGRETVGEGEEGGTETGAITTTPRIVIITTRATITGIHAHKTLLAPVACKQGNFLQVKVHTYRVFF